MHDAQSGGRKRRRFTVVAFHAHPDDEVLLTGGTLARAVADGHRVVVVTATAGGLGLTGGLQRDLAQARTRELSAATAALGVHRTEVLGYLDSGMVAAEAPPGAFCTIPVPMAARVLADLLVQEAADVLTVYDPHGGYGHPDHVHVHHVGRAAARLAGTPVVLEATVNRDRLRRALRVLRWTGVRITGLRPDALDMAYRAETELTHAVDVRSVLGCKLAAMRAHTTQTSGGEGVRTMALLLRLPPPIRRRVLGTEWFVEVGRPVPDRPLTDPFGSLRG
jgi:LmbE family N-acetylglucosaminyl deacetylase